MTTSYLTQSSEFQTNYARLTLGSDEKEIEKKYPNHFKANKKIKETTSKAIQSLESWSQATPGNLIWIKKQVNKLSKFGPLKPILNFFGVSDEKLTPRKSAETPNEFEEISDTEKEKLQKKAKLYNTLSKIALIVGSILVAIGIFLPLLLSPLLFVIPLTASLVTIIALTALGVAGAAAIVANPLLKRSKPIRENRLHEDPDFKPFLKRFLQNSRHEKPGYNLNKEDLTDPKLHKIYLEWQQEMKSIFSKKMVKKIENETK